MVSYTSKQWMTLVQLLSIVFFIPGCFFLLLLKDSLDGSYKSNVLMFAQMEMSSMIFLVCSGSRICLLIKIGDFYS